MFDHGMGGVEREAVERLRAAETARRQEHYARLEQVAVIERLGVARQTGHRAAAGLVAEVLRVERAEATRLVAEARDLTPGMSLQGETLPPRYPCTARVYAAGEIAPAHVVIVRRTMRRLERVADLAVERVVWAEGYLAEQATLLGPRGLQQAADALLAHLDPDGAAPDDDEDRWDELLIHTRRDGTMTMRAAFRDPVDTALLRAGFDAGSVPAGPEDTRSLGQRQAAALKEFVGAATGPHGILTDDDHPDTDTDDEPEPADAEDAEDIEETAEALIPAPRRPQARPTPTRAPVAGAGRALLTITIDHRWLADQLGHGVLDDAARAHVRAVRRWACDAEILPMLLGSRSEPLDVGRRQRSVPDAIRRALNHRDQGCAFPGCPRRPRRCHAHHIEHWIDGGHTRLDNSS